VREVSSGPTPPPGRPPYVRPQPPPGRGQPARPQPGRVEPGRTPTGRAQVGRPQVPRPTGAGAQQAPKAVRSQTYVAADARTARALPGLVLADRRGLTAAGGVVLSLLLGVAGAAFDVLTGSGLRTAFAACFVVGCVLTALTVHREDLGAAVVMPPLIYVTLSVVIGALARTRNTGSFVLQQAIEIGNAVVLGAPVLLLGTAAAALVAGLRWLGGRTA
jgi:hypothetical protein